MGWRRGFHPGPEAPSKLGIRCREGRAHRNGAASGFSHAASIIVHFIPGLLNKVSFVNKRNICSAHDFYFKVLKTNAAEPEFLMWNPWN